MPDNATNIAIDFPILVEGKPVREISIRRPKARDLKAFDQAKGGDMAKMFALTERLTNVPESSLDEMDLADFAKVSEVVGGFFAPFRRIGESA